jgi:hypothetical protein
VFGRPTAHGIDLTIHEFIADRLLRLPIQVGERLRQQGLRPIQIWVPDVRSPAFRSEAHRQSAAVAASAHAFDDQAFIDAVSDWNDE